MRRFLSAALVMFLRMKSTVCVLLACLLLGVPVDVYANTARFIDSGYEIDRATPSIYWIDDHRLLFVGYKIADMNAAIAAKDSSSRERLRRIYVWDIRQKSIEEYARGNRVCFSDGWVSYQVDVDSSARVETVKEGRLGSEQETKRAFLRMGELRSNITCRRHSLGDLVPPAPRHRRIVVLREGDGYLDLGPSIGFEKSDGGSNTLRIFEGKTGAAALLPISFKEDISQSEVAYSAYRGAYVLRPRRPSDGAQHWPRGMPLRVYLLWRNGRLETVTIPYLPVEYLRSPLPTKGGWIFGGGTRPATAGVYLFDGKAASKVDTGHVYQISVAPDGCRVAVGIRNQHMDMGAPINVRVLELCLGG